MLMNLSYPVVTFCASSNSSTSSTGSISMTGMVELLKNNYVESKSRVEPDELLRYLPVTKKFPVDELSYDIIVR
jgi:hypothetical protein